MKGFLLALFCVVCVVGASAGTLKPAAIFGVDWIDGRILPLEGRAFDDVENYYDRLPANVSTAVCANVRALKHDTSGLQFRFTTTSPTICLRWTPYYDHWVRRLPGCVLNGLGMAHMPVTGVSGLDIYTQRADGRWVYLKTGDIHPGEGACVSTGRVDVVRIPPGTPILINLPLYNGLRSFELGVERGSSVAPLPKRRSGVEKPVVFYGTSITQGACASRPGMAFVNIVGRELDVPVVNLGFSGGGEMELEMSEYLSRIDASCYVLDAIANMNPWSEMKSRYEPFIRNLRAKRPDVPIIMAEQSNVWSVTRGDRDEYIHALYEKLVAEGWRDLYYLPKTKMLPDQESTVDGCHPNDLGMRSLARAFGGVVKTALKLN